jgi:hypothetical protein
VNSNNSATLNNAVGHVEKGAYYLIGGVCTIVEIELHVVNIPLQKCGAVIKFLIEANNELDIAFLEMIKAVEIGSWELSLQS